MKQHIITLMLLSLLTGATLFPVGVRAQDSGQDSPPPVTVRFWHAFGGGYLPYMERMIADFNQTHPGIVIEATPQGSYEDTLTAFLDARDTGGELPHLLHLADVDTQRAMDSAAFAPLDAGEGYFASVITSEMAIPVNLSLPLLYGNRGLLEAAGISTLPTSQEEIQAACEALAASNTPCITWPIDAWLIQNWLNGAEFTPESMTAFATWWQTLSNNRHYVRPRAIADWESALGSFLAGEVALLIASSEDVMRLENTADFDLMAGAMPGAQTDFVPRGGLIWLSAAASPEEQAAAQTFVRWLTNTENSVRWHKLTGYLPLRPLSVSVLEEQTWAETSPVYALAARQLAEGQNVGAWEGAQRQINLIVEETLLQILQGNNVERSLANMAQRIQTTRERYGQ